MLGWSHTGNHCQYCWRKESSRNNTTIYVVFLWTQITCSLLALRIFSWTLDYQDTCDELLSFHHGSAQLVTHLALLFSFSLFSVLLWMRVDLMMWRNKLKHAVANGSRHHTTVSFRRYKSAIQKKSVIETWYGISLVLESDTKSNTGNKFIFRIFQFRHIFSN